MQSLQFRRKKGNRMANKVKFGFKNCYYATVTESGDTVTYGTPTALKGAVSMSLSPSGETTEFYADDGIYFSDENNNGYEGTLELALIPDDFAKDCLGIVEDANGVLTESVIKNNKPFALLCEFTGDDKATRFAFYRCMATRPDIASTTKGENIEVATETLNLTIRPRADGVVKNKTGATTDTTTYNGWYSAVYEGVAPSA